VGLRQVGHHQLPSNRLKHAGKRFTLDREMTMKRAPVDPQMMRDHLCSTAAAGQQRKHQLAHDHRGPGARIQGLFEQTTRHARQRRVTSPRFRSQIACPQHNAVESRAKRNGSAEECRVPRGLCRRRMAKMYRHRAPMRAKQFTQDAAHDPQRELDRLTRTGRPLVSEIFLYRHLLASDGHPHHQRRVEQLQVPQKCLQRLSHTRLFLEHQADGPKTGELTA